MKLARGGAMMAGLLIGVAAACGGKTDIAAGDGGAGTGGATSDGGAGTGGAASYDTCAVSDDCVVRPASCCGSCGAATRGDAIGINRERASAWVADRCSNVGCPACYMEQDPTLVAACVSRRCSVVDVRNDPATACSSSSDCRIRTTSCCECGGDTDRAHLVAVSDETRFASLVCEGVGACSGCAPIYPSNVVARCTDQHCEAVWLTE